MPVPYGKTSYKAHLSPIAGSLYVPKDNGFLAKLLKKINDSLFIVLAHDYHISDSHVEGGTHFGNINVAQFHDMTENVGYSFQR